MDVNLEDLTDDEDFLFVVRNVVYERAERVFRERASQFDKWNDQEFRQRFRLSKNTVTFVTDAIRERIAPIAPNKNHALSAEEKVLLTLRFLATGSFLRIVGDVNHVHESTASRVVHEVCVALAQLAPRYINFPETYDERKEVIGQFKRIARFPRCLGAIDCTHIKIQSPGGENAENFRNRKGYFSYNVQAVCDAKLRIQDIVCRWPGGSHDSTIFKNSNVRRRFENGEMENSVLVGDSGYAVKSYLITPLAHPQGAIENLFNESQIRTRNPIERCFGELKRRFPILFLGIRLQHQKVEAVVIACAVLHNIAREANDELPPLEPEDEELLDLENNMIDNVVLPNNRGTENNNVRYGLIHGYFRRIYNEK